MIYKFFTCPICSKTSSAADWNAETMKQCTTAFLKKTYLRIERSLKQVRSYVCPHCKHTCVNIKITPALNEPIKPTNT